MIIATEPGHPFDYYVRALRGQYNNNLQKLIEDCNKEIFFMRRNQTSWFMSVPHAKLQVGKFYLINYDFNGNKLYCPIFTIDYRLKESGKHVIYAINLDYLPFDYKVLYFNKLQDLTKQLFEFNADAPDFMREKAIPINFEQIYNTLKDNGDYNYAISAFDVTKLTEIFGVSTNLMYLMIHVHLRPVNVALMKTLMESYEKGTEEREKLEKIISELDNVYETYEEDVQNYYKKLKSIEANYKLFEN